MIPIGSLQLRPAKQGERFNGPELFVGDVAILRTHLPNLTIWKRIPLKEIGLVPTRDEAIELLTGLKSYLETKEWDREPYYRSSMRDSRITWHELFRDILIPFLETELSVPT